MCRQLNCVMLLADEQLWSWLHFGWPLCKTAPTNRGLQSVSAINSRWWSLSSSSSPLCRVFVLIFLRQTMSLGNAVLQLFWCYYSWCLYRYFQCWIYCNFYISTFRSMCAVPNVAVFCSSLTSHFRGMLLTYFLNDFVVVVIIIIIIIIIINFQSIALTSLKVYYGF